MKKTLKIWLSATRVAGAGLFAVLDGGVAESIDNRGLGRAALNPLRGMGLQASIEIFRQFARPMVQLLGAIEFELKAEFRHQRFIRRPQVPDRNARFRAQLAAEVEFPGIEQILGDLRI